MNPIYVPLLSALAGALIGSFSSIAVILIQAKIGDRRERLRQAANLAMEEYKIQITNLAPGKAIMPFSTFLNSQLAMLQAIEENDYTPDRLRKIAAMNHLMFDAHLDLDKEWRDRQRQRPGNPTDRT